jgi:uncharacterized membrane protein YebE (DUF533 family)
MFDAKALLDQFLGAGTGAKADDLLGRAKTQGGDYLSKGVGMAETKATEMFGAEKVQGAKDWVANNQLATGAALGGLAAVLLGTKAGRAIGGTTLKAGALAAVAGLAYKAYTDWQAGQAAPTGATPPPMPTSASRTAGATDTGIDDPEQRFAMALVIAMISAAKADGFIDDEERAAISERMRALPLDGEARAFLEAEYAAPLDIDRVAAGATSVEEATQIYAASIMAIDPDHPAERAYLTRLAMKLKLDPNLVASIERSVADART